MYRTIWDFTGQFEIVQDNFFLAPDNNSYRRHTPPLWRRFFSSRLRSVGQFFSSRLRSVGQFFRRAYVCNYKFRFSDRLLLHFLVKSCYNIIHLSEFKFSGITICVSESKKCLREVGFVQNALKERRKRSENDMYLVHFNL